MALTNTQYDTIIRGYNKKQLQNRRDQESRIALAEKELPELSKINEEIASLSMKCARRLLNDEPASVEELKTEIAAYGKHRKILLKNAGFPEDFLEMHYTCPDCKDTGYIGNEKCHCFRQAAINLLYTQSNLTSILETENFDHFCFHYYPENMKDHITGRNARENIQKIVDECLLFVQNFDVEHENLLFYGATGVGKIFLTHCIAKELLERAHSVIYFTSFDLFEVLSAATFGRSRAEDEVLLQHSAIFDCDLLIIDDLGTEMTNTFVSSQLFLCINERLMNKKSTIISTNLTLKNFSDTYSERTFSRIASNYQMISLIGKDIRIQKIFLGGN